MVVSILKSNSMDLHLKVCLKVFTELAHRLLSKTGVNRHYTVPSNTPCL